MRRHPKSDTLFPENLAALFHRLDAMRCPACRELAFLPHHCPAEGKLLPWLPRRRAVRAILPVSRAADGQTAG